MKPDRLVSATELAHAHDFLITRETQHDLNQDGPALFTRRHNHVCQGIPAAVWTAATWEKAHSAVHLNIGDTQVEVFMMN